MVTRLLHRLLVPAVGGIVAFSGTGQALAVPSTPLPSLIQVSSDSLGGSEALAACVRGERVGRVVLLMDESGSLQSTDPAAARVDAAQHLMRSWAKQVEGSDIDLQVQVMGFYDTGRASTGWVDVGDSDELLNDLDSYRRRNEGRQTDYLMGLNAARSALMGSQQHSHPGCQAIIWFSDGKLEAGSYYASDGQATLKPYLDEEMDMAAVSELAAEELCRAGGAADQLRAADINLLAIGLASDATAESDFDLMRSIATESTCGGLTANGSFLLARDIDDLVIAFASIARPEAPVIQDAAICQGAASEGCVHTFVLDDSIANVNVLVTSEIPGLDVAVIAPGLAPALFPSQDSNAVAEVGSAEATVDRLTDRTTNIEMTASGGWAGEWGVALVDPASNSATGTSQSMLHLTSDIQPVWRPADNDELRVGEPSSQTFGLERQDGTRIEPSEILGDLRLDVVLVTPDGTRMPIGSGLDAAALGQGHNVDLGDASPGRGSMELTLNLVTAGFETADGTAVPGTELAPVDVHQRAEILAPFGMPAVGESIDFGTVVDGQSAEGALTITGPGCVWIDPGSMQIQASPDAANPVRLTASATSVDSCVEVAENDSGQLDIELGTAAPSLGGLIGNVTVHLASLEDLDQQTTVIRPFTADLDKSPRQEVWWLTLVGLVGLGVGIPLLLLYLTKWRASRIPGRDLLAQTFPISLTDGRSDAGVLPGRLTAADFRDPVPVPRAGVKELQIGPVTLSARQGWSPFGVGEVEATVGGMAGISKSSRTPTKHGAARMPLSVHNNWALFRDNGGTSALLLYLASVERSREEIEAELAEIVMNIDEELATLATAGVPAATSRSRRRAGRHGGSVKSDEAQPKAVEPGSSGMGDDVTWDADSADWGFDSLDAPAAKDSGNHAPAAPTAQSGAPQGNSPTYSQPTAQESRSNGSTGPVHDAVSDDFDFAFDDLDLSWDDNSGSSDSTGDDR